MCEVIIEENAVGDKDEGAKRRTWQEGVKKCSGRKLPECSSRNPGHRGMVREEAITAIIKKSRTQRNGQGGS